MSAKVLIPIVVIIGVLIGIAVGLPIFDVVITDSAFEISDFKIPAGQYTWRAFNIPKGSTIAISYVCDKEVIAYLFTDNQFTNFKNVGEDVCLDSIKQVTWGNIRYDVQTTGKYYFVLVNARAHRSVQISSAKGDIITTTKITLMQKITG